MDKEIDYLTKVHSQLTAQMNKSKSEAETYQKEFQQRIMMVKTLIHQIEMVDNTLKFIKDSLGEKLEPEIFDESNGDEKWEIPERWAENPTVSVSEEERAEARRVRAANIKARENGSSPQGTSAKEAL